MVTRQIRKNSLLVSRLNSQQLNSQGGSEPDQVAKPRELKNLVTESYTRPCGPRRSTPKIWAKIHAAVQEKMVVA